MQFRSGDWVVVRSKEEILATLDKNARLEGLPFMPEMFQYCGRRIRVSSSAHKTCGPDNGNYVALQTRNLVHLGNRCDGSAHDGCQNFCQFFWHTDWLRAADAAAGAASAARSNRGGCTYDDVVAATRAPDKNGAKCYSCQALALKSYTRPLKVWDARAYWKALATRNHTVSELVGGLTFALFCKIAGPYGERFGLRRAYDAVQALRGGERFPRRHGLVRAGTQTPVSKLDLKEGDHVRIKSHQDILETLTYDGKNRGMYFDAELVPFCGRVFRVKAVVERFIDEEVGVMRHMKTPAVILDNVYCLSIYTGKRAFCTRGYYSWWREAWLERVSDEVAARERAAVPQTAAAAREVPEIVAARRPSCDAL